MILLNREHEQLLSYECSRSFIAPVSEEEAGAFMLTEIVSLGGGGNLPALIDIGGNLKEGLNE